MFKVFYMQEGQKLKKRFCTFSTLVNAERLQRDYLTSCFTYESHEQNFTFHLISD